MHYNPQYDDGALLAAITQGDEIAFARLFAKYRDKVYFFAWKLLGSESRAEDVLQEIFLKIWQGREKLTEVQNFKAYLNTLTRNHIYNALRRQAVEENYIRELFATGATSIESPAPDSLALAELRRALQKALSMLTPQQKRIFELSRMEGLKHEQIARELGISSNTVRKHMTDALRVIRIQLQGREMLAPMAILLLGMHL